MMLTPGTAAASTANRRERSSARVSHGRSSLRLVALARRPEIVSLKPGENRAAANIQLRAERPVTVSGIVTGPEGALPVDRAPADASAPTATRFPDRDFDAGDRN
jgi:hypothetical protein